MKVRFIKHLRGGGDRDAERVYRWHIDRRRYANAKIGLGMDSKGSTDNYVAAAYQLCASMGNAGFIARFAIPVDVDGVLLDGSHRLACAIVYGIDAIPVITYRGRRAHAPPWDFEWFFSKGMPRDDLVQTVSDLVALIDTRRHQDPVK